MALLRIFCIISTFILIAQCDSILDVVEDIIESDTDDWGTPKPGAGKKPVTKPVAEKSKSILDIADVIIDSDVDKSGALKPIGSLLQAATRKKFNDKVTVHYKQGITAYNSLLDAIHADLSRTTTEADELGVDPDIIPKEISPAAKSAAKKLETQLRSASSNCQNLVSELDAKALAKGNDVSILEQKIRQHSKKLNQAKSKRDGAQKAVDLAQRNLRSKENDIRAHEESVRHYERKVRKARNKCLGIGGWLGKQLCKVVNAITGKLRGAKRDLRRARNALQDSRNKHSAAVNNLTKENRKYNDVEKEMNRLRQQQSIERVSLHNSKKDRDQVDALNIKMKRSLTIIDNIKGGAENLKMETDLEYYLDIDNVVTPLKEMGQTVAGLNGAGSTSGFLPKLTDAQIKEIKNKLSRLKGTV